MVMKKICANCGHDCEIDDKRVGTLSKNLSGASKLYYDMWNFDIERCPNCNYASLDISKKPEVKLNSYKLHAILQDKVLNELYNCKPHSIFNYLLASAYYEEIGDTLMQAKCVLQAGDWMYYELPYFVDEFLDETDKEGIKYYQDYAKHYYEQAVALLEAYVDKHPSDFDAKLLLAGVLQEMDGSYKFKSNVILRAISLDKLSNEQKEIYNFLCQDIE